MQELWEHYKRHREHIHNYKSEGEEKEKGKEEIFEAVIIENFWN